jgi:hypothetical protein
MLVSDLMLVLLPPFCFGNDYFFASTIAVSAEYDRCGEACETRNKAALRYELGRASVDRIDQPII